jgi:hypothetical protein
MESKDGSENFFEKFGLEVANGEVEVGKTYPIYGMITKILNETPGEVLVEINFSIKAKMSIPTQEKVEILKRRAFEPGIFISTVKTKDEDGSIFVDCQTVVFGKEQQHAA